MAAGVIAAGIFLMVPAPVRGSWRRRKRGEFAGGAWIRGTVGIRGAVERAMVNFVLAFSFCDWILRGKNMLVGRFLCTANRAQYCKLCCFRTVTSWFGVGRGKMIVGRASSISP